MHHLAANPKEIAGTPLALRAWWQKTFFGHDGDAARRGLRLRGLIQDVRQTLLDVVVQKRVRYSSESNTGVQYFHLHASKATLDEIDRLLAPHCGLTPEETEFLVN